eukprot:scaffold319150_cov19-Tisochrysis_lutea.AAC.2
MQCGVAGCCCRCGGMHAGQRRRICRFPRAMAVAVPGLCHIHCTGARFCSLLGCHTQNRRCQLGSQPQQQYELHVPGSDGCTARRFCSSNIMAMQHACAWLRYKHDARIVPAPKDRLPLRPLWLPGGLVQMTAWCSDFFPAPT